MAYVVRGRKLPLILLLNKINCHMSILGCYCGQTEWVFKKHRDVALRDMVSGHGGDGLGLDLVVLVVCSNLNHPGLVAEQACKCLP